MKKCSWYAVSASESLVSFKSSTSIACWKSFGSRKRQEENRFLILRLPKTK